MASEGPERRDTQFEGGRRGGAGTAALGSRKPLRADARRNVDKLVAAARQVFIEHGAGASLDEIARRAGVGPGTLYRHFPNRGSLIEAVYRDGVATLCRTGDRLAATEPPGEALVDWLRAFVTYVGDKRALASKLVETIDHRDEVFRESHRMIEATAMALLDRARAAGAVRPEIELKDLIRLTSAIALAGDNSPEGIAQSNRLLLLAIDGLRPSRA
jgi:AcrR family transcriptional regulator